MWNKDNQELSKLTEAFNLGKEALELERQGIKLKDEQVALANLARDAEQALLGSFVKQIEAAQGFERSTRKNAEKRAR